MRWLAGLLTRLGLTPAEVVVIEVRGRRTGRLVRTTPVRAELEDRRYLIGRGGEAQWLRNVRAAHGSVTVARGCRRRAAHLRELAPHERPCTRACRTRGEPLETPTAMDDEDRLQRR